MVFYVSLVAILLLIVFIFLMFSLLIIHTGKYFSIIFIYGIQIFLLFMHLSYIILNFHFSEYQVICFVIFKFITTICFLYSFPFYLYLKLPVLAAAPDITLFPPPVIHLFLIIFLLQKIISISHINYINSLSLLS